MNLADAIRKWSSLTPDNTAIIDATTDRRCTFSGLLDRVTRLANGLSELGLTRGDRVAVLSTNSIEYFEVYYACAMAGFIAQPINWRLSPEEVARIIEDGEPSVFLCHADFLELRHDVVKRLSTMWARMILFSYSTRAAQPGSARAPCTPIILCTWAC